ncbi:MAG TPA: hypothetical protein VGT44_05440 [Ktedonobacteraceae bacterium]|nr:hypothetical protein [Ktedonobacteraceae bacterium]
MPTGDEKLTALLADLREMASYLHGQGEKKLALARRFEEDAKKDAANREFDLSQAKMLDYQHYIWHEIANMVEKLVKQYEK